MTAPRPKGTKRADRRALVDAGKRYHAAKLANEYDASDAAITDWAARQQEYVFAKSALVYAAECYAVGRRRASVEYGHKRYKRSQKAKP